MSVTTQIALAFKDQYNIRFFVETGTFVGSTCQWAARYFEEVYTIEASSDYVYRTSMRMRMDRIYDNVHFVRNRSEDCLGEVLTHVKGLAIIWLDAHWSSDLLYSKPSVVCPVLQEIKWIQNDNRNHIIMVDDARLFGVEPQWPTRKEVFEALSYKKRIVQEIEDVLVSMPIFD